jgi:hypothetical protein
MPRLGPVRKAIFPDITWVGSQAGMICSIFWDSGTRVEDGTRSNRPEARAAPSSRQVFGVPLLWRRRTVREEGNRHD